MNKLFEVERHLAAGPNPVPLPPDLHKSIMHAVREQPSETMQSHALAGSGWLHWMSLAGATGCILLGLLLLQEAAPKRNAAGRGPATPAVALAAPAEALKFGNNLPGALPNSLAPLSDELRRVQRDLARTADFLWATVPGG